MQGARNLRVKPKHRLDSDLFDNTTLGPKGNSQKKTKNYFNLLSEESEMILGTFETELAVGHF